MTSFPLVPVSLSSIPPIRGPSLPSVRNYYARHVVDLHHQKLGTLPPLRLPRRQDDKKIVTVGILGGGAAGLYSALIIKALDDPNLTYTLLEGRDDSDEKRGPWGGRLYTYNFSKTPNDYYDVGAMRFPTFKPANSNYMLRVSNLFDYIGVELGDYIMTADHQISYFNGKRIYGPVPNTADPFHTTLSVMGTGEDLIEATFGEWKRMLISPPGFDANFQKIVQQYDKYSTRDYMVLEKHYSDDNIDYLETMNSATNLYDCALMESLVDSLDFDYPNDNVNWHYVKGGANQIAQKMIAMLDPDKCHSGKQVTAIAPVTPTSGGNPALSISITLANEPSPRTYSHIICTLPLPCLARIDTKACNLPWDVQTAIRALHYDAATKVAIQFAYRWWETLSPPQVGGVSSTDRPTRVVVYPSYGIGNDAATMIVSYSWAQDALRMGAIDLDTAKDVILKDLTDMHNITDADGVIDYTFLPKLVKNVHAHSWYEDEFAGGAFALFGPTQFSNLFPKLTTPAGGLLHFAGEAHSAHHAWVIGALNSAYRSVYEILLAEGRKDLIEKLRKLPQFEGIDEEFDPVALEKQIRAGQRWF